MSYKSVMLMLGNISHYVNFPIVKSSVQKSSVDEYEDYEDYEDSDLIVVWETAVQPFSDLQRILFFSLTIIIVVFAVCGNILVLYVNFSRKQRFLFRACLISLAISDLIFVIVTSMIYLSKLYSAEVTLWKLGSVACSLLPFLQTMAVLVNSILLVCIALDRYMAVIRIVKGSWEPSKIFCVTCCVLIWGFSAAVSSPLLSIYEHNIIYVVPLPDPKEENPKLTYYTANLCSSNKAENAYYFGIIFSFIFVPLLITFFWLNSVLAKEVWKRRINVTTSAVDNENTSTISTTVNGGRVQEQITPEMSARRAERKQRQIRMFKVILVLMAVFFVCRLPNWIYVLYKLSNDTRANIFWVINYALGLMAMLNCLLNPFLYTFLSETIRLTTFLAGILCGIFRPCTKLFNCKKHKKCGCEEKNCEKSLSFTHM